MINNDLIEKTYGFRITDEDIRWYEGKAKLCFEHKDDVGVLANAVIALGIWTVLESTDVERVITLMPFVIERFPERPSEIIKGTAQIIEASFTPDESNKRIIEEVRSVGKREAIDMMVECWRRRLMDLDSYSRQGTEVMIMLYRDLITSVIRDKRSIAEVEQIETKVNAIVANIKDHGDKFEVFHEKAIDTRDSLVGALNIDGSIEMINQLSEALEIELDIPDGETIRNIIETCAETVATIMLCTTLMHAGILGDDLSAKLSEVLDRIKF